MATMAVGSRHLGRLAARLLAAAHTPKARAHRAAVQVHNQDRAADKAAFVDRAAAQQHSHRVVFDNRAYGREAA